MRRHLDRLVGLAHRTPMPEDAIKYFDGKGLKLTGDWRELWQEQHAKAFTVARLAKLDVLNDIYNAINDALKNGTTERQFIKDMTPLLQKKGWCVNQHRKMTRVQRPKLTRVSWLISSSV